MDNILTQMKEKEKSKNYGLQVAFIYKWHESRMHCYLVKEKKPVREQEKGGRTVDKKGEYKECIMSYMNENNNETH